MNKRKKIHFCSKKKKKDRESSGFLKSAGSLTVSCPLCGNPFSGRKQHVEALKWLAFELHSTWSTLHNSAPDMTTDKG
jgi:hypothetical protein